MVEKDKDDENKNEQTKQPPKINTIPVFRDSMKFDELFSDDEEVPCVLKDSQESIEIYVNMENKSLRKLQENITKGSDNSATVKILNDEYIKQIAYYNLILKVNEGKKNEEERMTENAKNEELKRAAILITGMINDNLQIYITESENKIGTEESN